MDDKTTKIIDLLSQEYPNAKSELVFDNAYQLLVAVILSAQCTDKRVNQVTKKLFDIASTPQKMADLPIETLEKLIFSCGFYKHKAMFLHNNALELLSKFNGEVPSDLESLRSLSGVGRKTANVVYAVAFNGQAIAVDTHVFRVSNRLGLAKAKNVLDTEKMLMQAIDKDLWSKSHHYLLLHGRYVCKSQKPNCSQCVVCDYCDYNKLNIGK